MKRLPYVPWFHGDFLRSTAGWTLLERAAYWMLLCAQWETGPLPTDMARLATIIGIDTAALTAIWPTIEPKFRRTRTGLVNRRMVDHQKRVIDYRRRQSEGGKKGMKNRWASKANVIDFRPKETPGG